jgi:hypothetical protein
MEVDYNCKEYNWIDKEMNKHGLNKDGKMKMYYGSKVIKKLIDQFKEKYIRMKKKDFNSINHKNKIILTDSLMVYSSSQCQVFYDATEFHVTTISHHHIYQLH